MPIPDINDLINSVTSALPDLFDSFWRGAQYAIGVFILIGIIYFLRRYL
jgi:hypothetical protein